MTLRDDVAVPASMVTREAPRTDPAAAAPQRPLHPALLGLLRLPRWTVLLRDALLALAAFGLAYGVRYELQLIRPVLEYHQAPFTPYLPYAAVYIVWLLGQYLSTGLYRQVRGRSFFEDVARITNGVTNATVLVMAISFLVQARVFSRLMMVYVALFTIVLLAGARLMGRVLSARLRTRYSVGVQRVLIAGHGDVGGALLRSMLARKALGYHPVGVLDDDPARGCTDLGRVRGLGALDNLPDAIRAHHIDLVVIAMAWRHHERIQKLVETCQHLGVAVRLVPDALQLNMRQLHVENFDGIPLLGAGADAVFSGTNRLIKRALDLVLVVLSAPVWLTVFALVALAIRLEGHGPVLYKARRVGLDGREFAMYKFRSMVPEADQMREALLRAHAHQDPRLFKLKDDPRITRVGRVIRPLSIDELPNIINVLLGHMSLVGPRPPRPDEVQLYRPWHRQRFATLPGITGLWQVSGRSDVPFDEMVLLDVYYIENWSVRLDLEILLRTVPLVLLRRGAY